MPDISLQHICKNCGHRFAENFCNRCGQKEVHRITTAHVFHDIVHVFLHTDKGIFPFIARIILKPGVMAREFVEGKRKIFNPFQYLILSVGVVFFLMLQSHFYESFESYNAERTAKFPGYFKKAMSDFTWFLKNYANIITFITLPLYALSSWLFFKRKGQNYAEHLTIQVFNMCAVNTLNAALLVPGIIFNFSNASTVTISILLIILTLTLTYKQFYSLKWYSALGKAIVVYIFSYIAQVFLIGLGLLLYIMILKAGY